MRPSTLRPSIMTPEGLALLQRETLANSPAAKAKARPTALAAGAYGSTRCVGSTVVARGFHGVSTATATIMLLCSAATREELHNEILKELTRRGLALHYVKDYGDTL